MKTFHRLLWFGVAIAASSILAVSVAYAADLNYSADTSIALTGGSIPQTITVLAGSGASSVVVNAGTLVATVPAGTTFSVSSAFYKILASAASGAILTESCSASQVHTATVSAQNTAVQTVTFVVASHRCGGVHSSAGAGGSLTLPSSTTTSTTPQIPENPPAQPPDQAALISSLQAQIRSLLDQITRLRGLSVMQSKFTVNLSSGSEGNEVTALQEFLRSQGSDIYPEGIVSGYFGSLTKRAVGRWQIRQGILAEGSSQLGVFGPRTRAAANAFIK